MEVCNDNRENLITKYKNQLIEDTNIEMSEKEMAVIDNILHRFWQMGWLDKLDFFDWNYDDIPPIDRIPCEVIGVNGRRYKKAFYSGSSWFYEYHISGTYEYIPIKEEIAKWRYTI